MNLSHYFPDRPTTAVGLIARAAYPAAVRSLPLIRAVQTWPEQAALASTALAAAARAERNGGCLRAASLCDAASARIAALLRHTGL